MPLSDRQEKRHNRTVARFACLWSPRASSEAGTSIHSHNPDSQSRAFSPSQGLCRGSFCKGVVSFTFESLSLGTRVIWGLFVRFKNYAVIHSNSLLQKAVSYLLPMHLCYCKSNEIGIIAKALHCTLSAKHLPSLYQVNSRENQGLELF